eukprot:scaffold85661_cov63-Phaeocystis_antarctica.AAC.1
MIFRFASAALAVLAAFNVASSLASPVTWAQHARGPSEPACTVQHTSARFRRGPAPFRHSL